jgi:hypothetical protein
MEEQLVILFLYRRYFTFEQREALEKNIRVGDNTLLNIFKEFVRHKDFVCFKAQSSRFADEIGARLKLVEQTIVERR